MTGDRPTTPGWHCHRCRSTSCRQRADSDTDHVGRVEYRPLLLTQPSSVSWLWSHTHWCPSQRPQEVMRVDGSANPTMPKNPAQYILVLATASIVLGSGPRYRGERGDSLDLVAADVRSAAPRAIRARCGWRLNACARRAAELSILFYSRSTRLTRGLKERKDNRQSKHQGRDGSTTRPGIWALLEHLECSQ